jgi:hypothetical protein
MRTLLTIPFILFIYFGLSAQVLSKKQVDEDLHFLKAQIEKYNPALAIYNPDFQSNAEHVIHKIQDDEITLLSHFAYISQICAMSNEGHFHMGNWSDDVHKGFGQNQYKCLPISVRALNGKLYVWEDYSEENQLEKGDELVSINGTSAGDILEQLYARIPSDGEITTYVDQTLNFGFAWMYYLLIDQPDVFEIACRRGDQQQKTIRIQALPRQQQVTLFAQKYPSTKQQEGIQDVYTLDLAADHARLTLRTFDRQMLEKHKIKSKQFYKQIFTSLKEQQVQNLIIDLRDNTGGLNEMADDMLPYILQENPETSTLKTTISWEGKIRTYKMPKQSKLRFSGKLYVLVNGRTYSAGASLARFLKEYGNAIVIGEETGTRYEGFAAGSTQFVLLPHSKLNIGIPRYHIAYPKSIKQMTQNRGLLPDFPIEYTIQDLIENQDRAYQFALKQISQSK